MADWQYSDFRPRWMREGSAEEQAAWAEMPDVGYPTDPVPRIATRILPAEGGNAVSMTTLIETGATTQRLFNYMAFEVVHGVDPSLCDQRRMDDQVLKLARLRVAPFEEGSFIIPAELSVEPVEFNRPEGKRTVLAQEVLARFNQVMDGIREQGPEFQTSIGVLQEIEGLDKVLRREAERVEFLTAGLADSPARRFSVDQEFVKVSSKFRKIRQGTRLEPAVLCGALIAVDLEAQRLKIRLDGGRLVKGTFMSLIREKIAGLFNQQARFRGIIRYQGGLPSSIEVYAAEEVGG